MERRRRILPCLAAAAAACLLVPPVAGGVEPEVWGTIDARLTGVAFGGPKGWRSLCRGGHEVCRPRPGARQVVLNRARYRELQAVQRAAHASIRSEPEPAGADEWLTAPAVGDCEDFALTKRALLIERGWPAGSLRFAVAYTEEGDFHAVLLVETDRGSLVLDNRFEPPVPWTELERRGYAWVGVEAAEAGSPPRWRLTGRGLALATEAAARVQPAAGP